jgi:hypothetical protein
MRPETPSTVRSDFFDHAVFAVRRSPSGWGWQVVTSYTPAHLPHNARVLHWRPTETWATRRAVRDARWVLRQQERAGVTDATLTIVAEVGTETAAAAPRPSPGVLAPARQMGRQ